MEISSQNNKHCGEENPDSKASSILIWNVLTQVSRMAKFVYVYLLYMHLRMSECLTYNYTKVQKSMSCDKSVQPRPQDHNYDHNSNQTKLMKSKKKQKWTDSMIFPYRIPRNLLVQLRCSRPHTLNVLAMFHLLYPLSCVASYRKNTLCLHCSLGLSFLQDVSDLVSSPDQLLT